MTEAEWLACIRVPELISALHGNSSERKIWLFACASCRGVWDRMSEVSRQVIEEVERHADGENRGDRLVTLLSEYYPHLVAVADIPGGPQAAEAVGHLGRRWRWNSRKTVPSPSGLSIHERFWVMQDVSRSAAEALAKSIPWDAARQREVELIRDIFAASYRPSPPLPRSVLTWSDGTIRRIAERIYEERRMPEGRLDTARLAILADALLDAGCDDEELLAHCRSAGPHVRGCWAVDLILGKA